MSIVIRPEYSCVVLKPMNCILLPLLASLAFFINNSHHHSFEVPAENIPLNIVRSIRIPSVLSKISTVFYLNTKIFLIVLKTDNNKGCQRIDLRIDHVLIHLAVHFLRHRCLQTIDRILMCLFEHTQYICFENTLLDNYFIFCLEFNK